MSKNPQDRRRTDPVEGKQVNFRRLGRSSNPPADKVTSVACVPYLRDGRLVAVRLRDRGLDIPGGHVQVGDASLEDSVRRELREEACITVGQISLAEVIESDYYGSAPDDLTYMVTFGAYVEDLAPFIPNEESEAREVVTPNEFFEQYEDRDGLELMRHAVGEAWSALSNTV